MGLLAPVEGVILLDGQPATPELWRAWREAVGIASQDDRLLSGTVADNISFFDPDANLSKIMSAATRAQIHDEIMRMPMQYRSLIGDMGSSLSGGQKQRVIIARVIYREPAVVFLDEGTANLDIENEKAIASIVSNMAATRVVIAHRQVLIEHADRVIRLESPEEYFREVIVDSDAMLADVVAARAHGH